MKWNKRAESVLIYLESCSVNYEGEVAGVRMNEDDHREIDKMVAEGLITFGRLSYSRVEESRESYNVARTHWVRFTDEAWDIVHGFRKERSARTIEAMERRYVSMGHIRIGAEQE